LQSREEYPYFTCLGRHSKRTDCTLRSINFYLAEDLIQEMYDRLALEPKYATTLRSTLTEQLQLLKNDTAVQAEALASQKLEIERRQRKLLEAHYNDAIPIEMLGTEQKRLDSELSRVNRELKDLTTALGDAARFIEMAIDLAEQSASVANSSFGERQSTHRIARFRRPESMEPPGRRSVAALYSQ